MKKIVTTVSILLMSCSFIYAAAQVTPVANVSLSGGQYYLDGDPSSFAGNGSVYFSPVVNFSQQDSLVPVLNIDYNGTQQVEDLVGGGTLTRESIDTGVSLKYVVNSGLFKHKLRIGWKNSFISETEDENWGEGLFDYNRFLIGFDTVRLISGYECKLSGDYYTMIFPNYSSLIYEDEYETSLDTTTYTEISNNAGEDVLDYTDTAFTLDVKKIYSDSVSAFLNYRIDMRNYEDQTIVRSDGSFSDSKRIDSLNTVLLGFNYKYERAVLSLSNTSSILTSNQNSYDANATKYISDFYSYFSTAFEPSISLYLGSSELKSRLKFWWDIEITKYKGRLAQNSDADYLSDKVTQTDNSFGLSYNYPINKNISVALQINQRYASSNMKYEANYKYNYSVSNYLLGLNWRM